MTTFTNAHTFYRVTWNNSSPHDYSALTNSQAGGIDPATPYAYHDRVSITSNVAVSTAVMAQGETILVNGQALSFNSTDYISDIVNTVNALMRFTGVFAHTAYAANCITFTNDLDNLGAPIQLAEGNGTALAKLGIAADSYKLRPSEYGTAVTGFTNGDTITINGTQITFTTAGGLTQPGVVSTINSQSTQSGVKAYAYGGNKIQLASVYGGPWVLGGTNVSHTGHTAGMHFGYPDNLTSSTNKNQANLRWQMVVNQLETVATPIFVGDYVATGNFNGNADVSTLTFTVGYEHVDQLSTADEYNAGVNLTGAAAIKRFVARGLAGFDTRNVRVFDPTLTPRGNVAVAVNSTLIQQATASAIAANVSVVEDNVSVSLISYT